MLNALRQELTRLAKDPHDPFAVKIRQHIGGRRDDHLIESLRNLVLVMPTLIQQIRAWIEVPDMPSEIKQLHGFVLTYLYNPTDVLPDKEAGLFGYLDDAYVVATVYHRTLSEIDWRERHPLKSAEDLPKQIPEWLDFTRQVLPQETIKIDRMFDDITEGNILSFTNLIEGPPWRRKKTEDESPSDTETANSPS